LRLDGSPSSRPSMLSAASNVWYQAQVATTGYGRSATVRQKPRCNSFPTFGDQEEQLRKPSSK
jgi:hypothetical protein